MILAVDSGTTSTRAWALDAGEIVGAALAGTGARDVARTNDRNGLLESVRLVAEQALHDAGRGWDEVEAVVAFGMITSELGLEELPHLRAPIDVAGLAAGLEERRYPEVLPATFLLVPGVLNADGHAADVMRGEETEVAGLLALAELQAPFVYVSTGSHTKFVAVDADGRIGWSLTTLSGELLLALQRETILAPLLDLERPVADFTAFEHGVALAAEEGLTRALFAARILNRIDGRNAEWCSAFLHGAVAAGDIAALRRRLEGRDGGRTRVAIRGRGPLTDGYAHLLAAEPGIESVRRLEQPVGAFGAWTLFTAQREARALRNEPLVGEGEA